MPTTIPTPLATLYPRPRRLRLAGREYRVAELRLRDVAELEWRLSRIAGDPLATLGEAEAEPDPKARRAGMMTLARAAIDWPVAFQSDRAAELMGTRAGAAAFLWVGLARHNPVDPAEVLALADALTEAEWDAVHSALWGERAHEVILRQLPSLEAEGQPPRRRHGPPPPDWGQMVDRLATERGWSYEVIGDLTLGRARCALRRGQPVEAGSVFPMADARNVARERWRAGQMPPTPVETALRLGWLKPEELPTLIEVVGPEVAKRCGWLDWTPQPEGTMP